METNALKTIENSPQRLRQTVKCPACHRKLCELSLDGRIAPHAEIQGRGVKYDLELRCASCKVFVGVIFQ